LRGQPTICSSWGDIWGLMEQRVTTLWTLRGNNRKRRGEEEGEYLVHFGGPQHH
jgi:hypothetical protein